MILGTVAVAFTFAFAGVIRIADSGLRAMGRVWKRLNG